MSDAQLEALLAAGPASAVDINGPIVLYGAGGLGRQMLAALRADGIDPVCFADRDGGDPVDGLERLPLTTAAERHGADATFVVTIFNPRFAYRDIKADIEAAGVRDVRYWIPLAWNHPHLLPNYAVDLPSKVIDAADDVRRAYALLGDDTSRAEFRAQLQWRLTGDPEPLGNPATPVSEQYFEVLDVLPDEVFVDGGAYDGDTIESLVAHGGFKKVYALEPDPANLTALDERLDRLQRDVEVLEYALGSERGSARWGGSGLSSAGIADDGELEVQIAPLDELLAGAAPTYIKLDIEGAELDALQGAANLVRTHRPVLGLCTYHVQDHLWKLALAVDALVDDYRYELRRYERDNWEVVLYAIPTERG